MPITNFSFAKTLMIMIIAFLFFNMTFLHQASADIGHYYITPRTGTLIPVKNAKISLQKVKVNIDADPSSDMISATCIFIFVNESDKAQEVVMGFPVAAAEGSGNLGITGLSDFQIKMGLHNPQLLLYPEPAIDLKTGQPKKFMGNALDEYKLMNTGKAGSKFEIVSSPNPRDRVKTAFGRELTTTIYWKYKFDPNEVQSFIVEYTADNWKDIIYITGTAGLWAEKVKTMDIYIEYPNDVPFHFLNVSLPNYEYKGNMLHWHYENYTPAQNEKIRVTIIDTWNDEQNNFPKDAFQFRFIKDVDYKLDKQYVRYSPTKESSDPESATGSILSPERFINEVSLMRNEIFARHGYIFKTPKYSEYFARQKWYRQNPSFMESELNYIEKRNVNYFQCIEIAAQRLPKKFAKYFPPKGILHYDNSMDGSDNTSDKRDEEYFELEREYKSSVNECYHKNLP